MVGYSRAEARQIWAVPTSTKDVPHSCRPTKLSSGGIVSVSGGPAINLGDGALFQPACTNHPTYNISDPDFNVSVLDFDTPFYASASPQAYALSACTIISYMLLIILFITPRTFFVGGAGGGNGFLGRRGMINGASGSTSVIGVGGRPWLQKVATLTVAVSLTIATADTFRVSEEQYDHGYQDALALTKEVLDGLELRIARIISSTCLWLALAQTLIRLFQRHREKVMIKWIGFFLIVLDTLFSALNSFISPQAKIRPRHFAGAIPALNYLFTFVLEIVYMLMVLQYALSKRRFAFYHAKMHNMSLMALLSITAVLIPVVFFTLDMLKPNVVGWGSYVRWVGAAAASVLVWEWVERIEALERDENKDGILGREIYDGDEMLADARSSVVSWPSSGYDPRSTAPPSTGLAAQPATRGVGHYALNGKLRSREKATQLGLQLITAYRKRRRRKPLVQDIEKLGDSNSTTSAAAVRDVSHQSQNPGDQALGTVPSSKQAQSSSDDHTLNQEVSGPSPTSQASGKADAQNFTWRIVPGSLQSMCNWLKPKELFTRHKRKAPPAEISHAQTYPNNVAYPGKTEECTVSTVPGASQVFPKLRMHRKARPQRAAKTAMSEIVIPWQPRGQELLNRLEQEEVGDRGQDVHIHSQPQTLQNVEFWRQEQRHQVPEVISRAQTMSPRSQGTQSAIGPEHSISVQGTPAPRDED